MLDIYILRVVVSMFNKIALSLALLFLTGCTSYVGIGMHASNYSTPEVMLCNPIGIVGFSKGVGDFDVFLEHHSGITCYESGYGYNLVGVKYYLSNDTK